MSHKEPSSHVSVPPQPDAKRPRCGLVMPISPTDGCSEQHWTEVRALLSEAITVAGFEPSLVSDAEDVGIIQKRIIQNLYGNPIVVCDVSGKNPNVMFELGLRLAFDKPTIIVKDDKTSYSFDTAPIEHLTYPRDLRYPQMVLFKTELAKKIQGTYTASQTDTSYTTFLKHFGTFTVAKLNEREVSRDEALFEELRELKTMVRTIRRTVVADESLPQSRSELSRSGLLSKAIDFILKYARENGLELAKLSQKRAEIIAALEKEIIPPVYFPSPDEWKSFCDTLFLALGDAGSADRAAGRDAGRLTSR